MYIYIYNIDKGAIEREEAKNITMSVGYAVRDGDGPELAFRSAMHVCGKRASAPWSTADIS